MDDNRVEGFARNLGGKIQDAVVGLTGNASTQVRGKANQASGQAQNLFGRVLDDAKDFASEQPLIALLTVGIAGLALGFIMRRR